MSGRLGYATARATPARMATETTPASTRPRKPKTRRARVACQPRGLEKEGERSPGFESEGISVQFASRPAIIKMGVWKTSSRQGTHQVGPFPQPGAPGRWPSIAGKAVGFWQRRIRPQTEKSF